MAGGKDFGVKSHGFQGERRESILAWKVNKGGINKILQDPRGGSGKFYCVTQPKSSNLSPQPSSDTDV